MNTFPLVKFWSLVHAPKRIANGDLRAGSSLETNRGFGKTSLVMNFSLFATEQVTLS